jgi:hypothetical protein
MSITPEVLHQVAERLGPDYTVITLDFGKQMHVRNGIAWDEMSDGDLLLAILKRAVELGGYIELCGQDEHWTARNSVIRLAHGPCRKPLEAAIQAFIQLPKVAA